MGSSPILAQGAPGSSVGRARTQRKTHLVYMAGWCNGSSSKFLNFVYPKFGITTYN